MDFSQAMVALQMELQIPSPRSIKYSLALTKTLASDKAKVFLLFNTYMIRRFE
jgi:hypothetical protein